MAYVLLPSLFNNRWILRTGLTRRASHQSKLFSVSLNDHPKCGGQILTYISPPYRFRLPLTTFIICLSRQQVFLTMLFKFTSADLHNATIIDCSTGAVVYRISTAVPGGRSRSLSASSLYSFASSSSSSRERLSSGSQKVTTLSSREGLGLAEITWEENRASLIRIGEEVLAGSAEIFDAAFIKVLPEETLIPTRMEYVWRTTPDSLTLLDDDGEVIGKLHADCISLEDELFPASKTGAGHSYLELGMIPPTEVLELLVSFLLISALRERMYWITRYVYGQQSLSPNSYKSPLRKLSRKASRSFAGIRDTLFRSKT